MKFIKNIITKIMPKDMNRKIDLSNEDHCGPCGEYALEKIKLKNNVTVDMHLENPK